MLASTQKFLASFEVFKLRVQNRFGDYSSFETQVRSKALSSYVEARL